MRSRNDFFKYQGGGDEPGPALEKLLEQLKAIQQGRVKDSFGWRESVREYTSDEYEVEGGKAKTNGVPNGHVPGQLP